MISRTAKHLTFTELCKNISFIPGDIDQGILPVIRWETCFNYSKSKWTKPSNKLSPAQLSKKALEGKLGTFSVNYLSDYILFYQDILAHSLLGYLLLCCIWKVETKSFISLKMQWRTTVVGGQAQTYYKALQVDMVGYCMSLKLFVVQLLSTWYLLWS